MKKVHYCNVHGACVEVEYNLCLTCEQGEGCFESDYPVIIGRPVNGIAINGLEWLLNDDNELKIFESKVSAVQYLLDNGFDDEEIRKLTFQKAN